MPLVCAIIHCFIIICRRSKKVKRFLEKGERNGNIAELAAFFTNISYCFRDSIVKSHSFFYCPDNGKRRYIFLQLSEMGF